jgi:hypothetical protein
MLTIIKRFVVVVTAVLAVSAPSVASARLELNPSISSPPVAQTQIPAAPSVQIATAAAPRSFQWDDAIIGAASALVLASIGSAGIIARRRRTQRPLAG